MNVVKNRMCRKETDVSDASPSSESVFSSLLFLFQSSCPFSLFFNMFLLFFFYRCSCIYGIIESVVGCIWCVCYSYCFFLYFEFILFVCFYCCSYCCCSVSFSSQSFLFILISFLSCFPSLLLVFLHSSFLTNHNPHWK